MFCYIKLKHGRLRGGTRNNREKIQIASRVEDLNCYPGNLRSYVIFSLISKKTPDPAGSYPGPSATYCRFILCSPELTSSTGLCKDIYGTGRQCKSEDLTGLRVGILT